MKKVIKIVLLYILALPCIVNAQPEKNKLVTDNVELAKLKAAVEAAPNSLAAHQAYTKAVGIDGAALETQYAIWIKKFPTSATVPYAIGKAYWDEELPQAKNYLLKATQLNPKWAEVWYQLYIDAQRWGDFEACREYLKNATEADPANGNYAFSYANAFVNEDEKKFLEMSMDVAKRFSTDNYGAVALWNVARKSSDVPYRIEIYELLKKKFSPAKYITSKVGMSDYYTLLLDVDAQKAVTLAQEMVNLKGDDYDGKEWMSSVTVAQNIVEIKKLINENKGTEALAVMDKMKLPRRFLYRDNLSLLKAAAISGSGNTQAAYDSLIVYFAKTPAVILKTGIDNYGAKLGKNAAQTEADIWKKLDAISPQATPFTLKNYLTPGSTSLADYKGKVVLLTYWFPGCGPCRAEFPHFENVIRKYKGQPVAYVGINCVPDQNGYVVPFMKTSGYSFTPLEDFKGRAMGNLDNKNAAPKNFLIDQQGRIIFSDFSIDENNEDQLELMISMLLRHKA